MVSSLLRHVLVPVATALLAGLKHPNGRPEDMGGINLKEVFIDPTEAGNKGEALLEDRSDQVLAGRNLNIGNNNNNARNNNWMGLGNDMLHILKRSDAEERQMNGRIRILKKRDNYNMDGKIRILKKRDDNMDGMDGKIRILKKENNDNMDGQIRILKKRDFNMNGKIRILKKRDFNMDGKIGILKKQDDFNMDGKIRILKKQDNYNMDDKIRTLKGVQNEMSNLQARLLEDQNTVGRGLISILNNFRPTRK